MGFDADKENVKNQTGSNANEPITSNFPAATGSQTRNRQYTQSEQGKGAGFRRGGGSEAMVKCDSADTTR